MPAITERLQNYASAMEDPTRGMILVELDRAGELTATQLARRLGLTANNVYHHMRILRSLDLVGEPRIVPGQTYVEKYYHVSPEISAALRLDPTWYNTVSESMTAGERKSTVISICLTMAHLLRRAAREYEELDTDTVDGFIRDQQLLLSIRRISREELMHRIAELQNATAGLDPKWAESTSPRTDLLLLAGLPSVWSENGDGSE